MSGFLQRLALRSAGLAPEANAAPVQLRPRGRFEPPSPASVGVDGLVEAAVPWAAPKEPMAEAVPAAGPSGGPRLRQAPGAPPGEAESERAAPSRRPGRPPSGRSGAASRPLRPPGEADGERAAGRARPEPPPGRAPDGIAARERAGVADGAALAATERDEPSLAVPAADAPWRARGAADEAGKAGTGAAVAETRASPPPQAPAVAESEPGDTPRAEADRRDARAEPRPGSPDGAAAPSFAFSIGRIDVEFVHPSPPATPPAPVNARVRGFAEYARIRRGAPR